MRSAPGVPAPPTETLIMSWQKFLIPSIVGCLAAVVTTYVQSATSARGTHAEGRPREHASDQRVSKDRVLHEVRVRSDDDRVAALEQELAEVKGRLDEDPEEGDVDAPSAADAPSAFFTEKFAQQARAFESDAVDAAWAPTATKTLNSSLEMLATTAQFSLVEAECRTAHCRAVVEFADLERAEMNAGGLAEARLGSLNCAQGIQVPPDADPDAPVRAELFLDCTDLRANSVNTLQ